MGGKQDRVSNTTPDVSEKKEERFSSTFYISTRKGREYQRHPIWERERREIPADTPYMRGERENVEETTPCVEGEAKEFLRACPRWSAKGRVSASSLSRTEKTQFQSDIQRQTIDQVIITARPLSWHARCVRRCAHV